MSFQKAGKAFQKVCSDEPLGSRDTAESDFGLCLIPLLPALCHVQTSLDRQSDHALSQPGPAVVQLQLAWERPFQLRSLTRKSLLEGTMCGLLAKPSRGLAGAQPRGNSQRCAEHPDPSCTVQLAAAAALSEGSRAAPRLMERLSAESQVWGGQPEHRAVSGRG